jgi:hypothetical protein
MELLVNTRLQIFPFSNQILGNLIETAPETWGDEGHTKGAMYDERSDVFSYAIILWRIFGVTPSIAPHSPSSPSFPSTRNSPNSPNPSTPPPVHHLPNSVVSPRPATAPSPSSSKAPISPTTPKFSDSPRASLPVGTLHADPIDVQSPYGHLKDKRGDELTKWALRNKIREVFFIYKKNS